MKKLPRRRIVARGATGILYLECGHRATRSRGEEKTGCVACWHASQTLLPRLKNFYLSGARIRCWPNGDYMYEKDIIRTGRSRAKRLFLVRAEDFRLAKRLHRHWRKTGDTENVKEVPPNAREPGVPSRRDHAFYESRTRIRGPGGSGGSDDPAPSNEVPVDHGV